MGSVKKKTLAPGRGKKRHSSGGSRLEKKTPLSQETLELLVRYQENEITENHIYSRLANLKSNFRNRDLLLRIASDEKRHYLHWKNYTGKDVAPAVSRILYYTVIARLFGLTFGIKLMERGEKDAKLNYSSISHVPGAAQIAAEEEMHEQELLKHIEEERLNYIGSIVLGLNDALVELTGALAGLTFAFQKASTVALAGLITGISAAFSMAASEYLSSRAESSSHVAMKASLYTGIAYIVTVILLIFPFFIFASPFYSLALTLVIAFIIIFVFNFYISVARDFPFKQRFLEMVLLSSGVSLLSFVIGTLVRKFIGVDL